MTIFDIINSIIFNKNKKCITSVDEENAFVPYMVNRWLSMYSPDLALVSNKLNKYLGVFQDKRDLLALFQTCFPLSKQKRIQYIKKKKLTEENINEKIPLIAASRELSKREITQYIAFLKK